MKRLTDADIEKMANAEFIPDTRAVNRAVRGELKLGHLIPTPDQPAPRHAVLDLHNHTEQQAWDAISALAASGTRDATIITGASGILKIKFQQWARDSILAPRIISVTPINNGSFAVKFRRDKNRKS